jgi:hypothetical protein
MTDDSYREDEKEELVKKKKESEKKDGEKKSVAFKATTSKVSVFGPVGVLSRRVGVACPYPGW